MLAHHPNAAVFPSVKHPEKGPGRVTMSGKAAWGRWAGSRAARRGFGSAGSGSMNGTGVGHGHRHTPVQPGRTGQKYRQGC